MALTDILTMESDIVEPVTEIPLENLYEPLDLLAINTINELTLTFEVSYSS